MAVNAEVPMRISGCEAMLLKDIEEENQKQKIKRLKQCGFENTEIAKMLGTTPNTVGVAVHSTKKSKKRKKR